MRVLEHFFHLRFPSRCLPSSLTEMLVRSWMDSVLARFDWNRTLTRSTSWNDLSSSYRWRALTWSRKISRKWIETWRHSICIFSIFIVIESKEQRNMTKTNQKKKRIELSRLVNTHSKLLSLQKPIDRFLRAWLLPWEFSVLWFIFEHSLDSPRKREMHYIIIIIIVIVVVIVTIRIRTGGRTSSLIISISRRIEERKSAQDRRTSRSCTTLSFWCSLRQTIRIVEECGD